MLEVFVEWLFVKKTHNMDNATILYEMEFYI